MTHQEFVESYNDGRIKVDIQKKKSFILLNEYKFHNPAIRKFQVIFFVLNWTWYFSLPLAIVCFIFLKWWVGIIVLIIGISIPRGLKDITSQVVFKQALKDKNFYDLLKDTNTLIIRENIHRKCSFKKQ